MNETRCLLAVEDGAVYVGAAFGATGTRFGEVVFNTSMAGYEEILTDPSYRGQIVVMTTPQMGNYGITGEDAESSRPHLAGFAIRELSARYSNHRARTGLADYLREHGVVGIQSIDTRALTRRVRMTGAMRGVVTTEVDDPARCVAMARAAPSMEGADLVSEVAPREPFAWREGTDPRFGNARPCIGRRADFARNNGNPRVVAIDCGMKRGILRQLVDRVGPVQVVPPTTTGRAVLDMRPDGVVVSNGPGDPAAVRATIATLQQLIGRVPIFGICLGHQLLALALGAKTVKMRFGHHGGNHPVRNAATGRVEITSQNHGFAVDEASLRSVGGEVTHVNLNDGTVEGFAAPDRAVLAVQYHPEASPGPHDATYLFDRFVDMMTPAPSPMANEASYARVALPTPAP
ncbi:MAG: glutamine-hydrolyzing carbamoyl-phosphate synthase small subunit [Phycisphaerales bacterium]|nr:glutamine-hydrolyzing carbamoyl-phosphate synthase small subunit [Phycisphaerales bacterium]